MIYGLDYLGGAKFTEVILKNHPFGWAAGFFAETFGHAYHTIEKLLASGKCPHVRIHLIWSDTHNYGDQDIPALIHLSEHYDKLGKLYPDVEVELSPFCEHKLQNPDKYLEIVKKHAPHCRPVNSIEPGGALSHKYKNEIHGGKAPDGAYNFSYDGKNCVDADIEHDKVVYSRGDVFFLWHCRFNGKWNLVDPTPRPIRIAYPDDNFMQSIIFLQTTKGATSVPKGWISKSHSERHNLEDIKGDKLLIISPYKSWDPLTREASQEGILELKTRDGTLVDTLKFFGSYVGGGFRYYSHLMGYFVALKAMRNQGDALCGVWQNGFSRGVVNPGFRDGVYR